MALPTETKSGSQISVPKKNPLTQNVSENFSHKAFVTPDEPVILDVSPPPTGVKESDASSADGPDHSEGCGQPLVTGTNLPACIPIGLPIFLGGDGNAYMEV